MYPRVTPCNQPECWCTASEGANNAGTGCLSSFAPTPVIGSYTGSLVAADAVISLSTKGDDVSWTPRWALRSIIPASRRSAMMHIALSRLDVATLADSGQQHAS